MNIIKRINAIIYKDFIESLRNKTVFIVILLPILASLLFSIVDNAEMNRSFNIGVVENQEGGIHSFVNNSVSNLKADLYENVVYGKQAVELGNIDALLVNEDDVFSLYINSSQAITYFFLKDSLEDIIRMYLNLETNLELEIVPMNVAISSLSFLPVWITVTVAMIGVLIISGNFAEEKENKTIHSIMLAPANKIEILLAKGIFSVLFTFFTIFIMAIFNGVFIIGMRNIFLLLLSILIASISFTAIGLLIGAFSESQSSARSIATIIYFPLLFPTLIADVSEFTRIFARFFPTYYLYQSLEKILIYQGRAIVYSDMLILLSFSLFLTIITYIKFRKVHI
ncbi:ABC transporter permease [Natronospora cellulosivora (SeqCode)]